MDALYSNPICCEKIKETATAGFGDGWEVNPLLALELGSYDFGATWLPSIKCGGVAIGIFRRCLCFGIIVYDYESGR